MVHSQGSNVAERLDKLRSENWPSKTVADLHKSHLNGMVMLEA